MRDPENILKKDKFIPKPGQIDFSKARWAPVINCVVRHRNKILLVRRNKSLKFYPGHWNGISGFLDDGKSLKEKIEEELKEEIGVSKDKIRKMRLGEIFDQEESKYKKTWIVHPVLVDVIDNNINLDWESEKYKWIKLEEAKKLKLLPGFENVLRKLSPWMKN